MGILFDEMYIFVPEGSLAQNNDSDAVARRRAALAQALRAGDDVVVTPSGEVEFAQEAEEQGHSGITVPEGKLADRR